MIIANPIYDTVFKYMMENERVAKFFISTLLDEQIETIEVKPQEFIYNSELTALAVFRLDFIATIKTESGELRKVLIEIQKAKNQIDLMRFRRYLGEQYRKEDQVANQTTILPITTIYILGFTLPEIETACIKVERNYKDLINAGVINRKSDFVEKLTHDSFIVQVNRITDRYQTRLDKLLSVFEQKNFTDDDKITKRFRHPTDTEDVKLLTDILHYSGTDPDARKRIEDEQEAWRTVDAMMGGQREKMVATLQALEKTEEKLGATTEKLEQTVAALEQKDQALEQKDQALEQKDQALEQKDQALEQKDQALEQKDQALAEMARQLEELKRRLGGS